MHHPSVSNIIYVCVTNQYIEYNHYIEYNKFVEQKHFNCTQNTLFAFSVNWLIS